jgi:hypothetical protein
MCVPWLIGVRGFEALQRSDLHADELVSLVEHGRAERAQVGGVELVC